MNKYSMSDLHIKTATTPNALAMLGWPKYMCELYTSVWDKHQTLGYFIDHDAAMMATVMLTKEQNAKLLPYPTIPGEAGLTVASGEQIEPEHFIIAHTDPDNLFSRPEIRFLRFLGKGDTTFVSLMFKDGKKQLHNLTGSRYFWEQVATAVVALFEKAKAI